MGRPKVLLFSALLVATAGSLLNLGACGGSSPSPPAVARMHHVVVIFQENRSTDNLFHGLANADIASSGVNSLGQTIPLQPAPLVDNYDLDHDHTSFLQMFDNGKMDGADKITFRCIPGAMGCPPPNPQFYYVNPSDVAPYFELAQQYTFGDRMFQTNQGPSFPAHQFIISGTSAPTATSPLFASEQPITAPNTSLAGCIASPFATVQLIDPAGDETATQYPCFEHPTLTDLLNAKGLSWTYYSPNIGSTWVGPSAIQHMCVPDSSGTICTGADWARVVVPETQILRDITGGHLPAVSWVIPGGQSSDHPATNEGSGPSWVAAVVNAIGNSQYWSDTTIIITWDDWGGWYDHVAPPILNSYEYGFRVPLIVVSPYAKPGYVSHVTHDFGSILRFIEEQYSLPSLGYADAIADDLADCFDFSQTPLPFQPITAKYDANYFLNDKRPRSDPDDD